MAEVRLYVGSRMARYHFGVTTGLCPCGLPIVATQGVFRDGSFTWRALIYGV